MRILKLQVQISIDGFIAGTNHEMDWIQLNWTSDLINYIANLTSKIDQILLGKNLAEGFIPYWQNVANNKNHPEHQAGIIFTNANKIVFSKTLKESQWLNTSVFNGNYVEEINRLKNENGNDMIVYGGAKFVASLIKENLIDEYNLLVNPNAIGKGLSIFNELHQNLELNLAECIKFDCGIALLKYIKKN